MTTHTHDFTEVQADLQCRPDTACSQLQVTTDDKSLKKIIFKWSNSVGLLMILIYSLGKTCQIFGKLYREKLSSLTTVNVNKLVGVC